MPSALHDANNARDTFGPDALAIVDVTRGRTG
jgi:hypothetical protein